MRVETYCGGAVETNGYLLLQDEMALVVDAPDGMAGWLAGRRQGHDLPIAALLLTHGHWDHIVDARLIQQRFRTPVWIHQNSVPLLENPSLQSAFNPFYDLQPCQADRLLDCEETIKLPGFEFGLLCCPGHCPGSLCFLFPKEKTLFTGDVLFAGGVGRWDLPGGAEKKLIHAIQTKILVLPEDTRVFPGHGPSTTVGQERRTNPYLCGLTPLCEGI